MKKRREDRGGGRQISRKIQRLLRPRSLLFRSRNPATIPPNKNKLSSTRARNAPPDPFAEIFRSIRSVQRSSSAVFARFRQFVGMTYSIGDSCVSGYAAPVIFRRGLFPRIFEASSEPKRKIKTGLRSRLSRRRYAVSAGEARRSFEFFNFGSRRTFAFRPPRRTRRRSFDPRKEECTINGGATKNGSSRSATKTGKGPH